LERLIGERCALAQDRCPEAAVEVEPGVDARDAWIEVMVPDEQEEAVHDALIQRAHELFMEEGYALGVHVTERSAHKPCAAHESAGV
jgi:hypothetical protein